MPSPAWPVFDRRINTRPVPSGRNAKSSRLSATSSARRTIFMAAGGYPDNYRKGDAISGLEAAARLPGKVFHAGATMRNSDVVTSGGRVLCAVGLGATVADAQAKTYDLVHTIH
ncbi:MAG: phosphoribosylglycinamide synthetase C domain-containing protein [Steroidobacteraceae bacterium]